MFTLLWAALAVSKQYERSIKKKSMEEDSEVGHGQVKY